jgi:hypothetical protein
VEGKGKGGGLALWWRDGIDVSVRPWCQYFIDAKITSEAGSWRFTGVYGEPRTQLREKTWEAMRYLYAQDDLPWLCCGDFNEILQQTEQIGQNQRSENQMKKFRRCLTDCRLVDLGYSGYPFTWDNKREGLANVQAHLDRATSNEQFLDMFPQTNVQHIITEESDHMALLIRVAVEADSHSLPASRGFMFEEMWTKHENYDSMVKNAWQASTWCGGGVDGLWNRLKEVSKEMKRWSFNSFGSVRKEIKRLKAELEAAKTQALCSDTSLEVRRIEQKLHEVFEKEEIM